MAQGEPSPAVVVAAFALFLGGAEGVARITSPLACTLVQAVV
jgi:hypothetical protein